MERPRKVEEQQGNQQKEEDRRNDPDFSQHLYLSLLYGIFVIRHFHARRPSSYASCIAGEDSISPTCQAPTP